MDYEDRTKANSGPAMAEKIRDIVLQALINDPSVSDMFASAWLEVEASRIAHSMGITYINAVAQMRDTAKAVAKREI